MSRYKHIYVDLLPVFLPASTFVGLISGLTARTDTYCPLDVFTNIIGYTSIGILTGLSYPISFPLISAYVLITKNNK
jgi:hypothetical protein